MNRIPDKNRDAAKWPIEFMQQNSATQGTIICVNVAGKKIKLRTLILIGIVSDLLT
jgi:hypothetical protein